jgi:Zn-dependent M28 family amino/carboxypeptidase
MSHGQRALGALLALAFAGGLAATSAQAATQTDTQRLQNAVAVGGNKSGIRQHLKKLQEIADANEGNRSTGTKGHTDSAAYVINKLKTAGDYWNVTTQPFTAIVFSETAPATLSAAGAPTWTEGADFGTMEFSGTGTVTDAPVAVVGFVEPTQTASASAAGCDPATVPDLTGKVAIIQRGTCDFGVKAENAQAKNAAGVIIFNEGTLGDPDRNGMINGTLGRELQIPVLEATYAVGRFFVDHPDTTVSLAAFGVTDRKPTYNVIAESAAGRADRTIISGAHLDSVPEGPGINDDGSGSATQLETALQMAKLGIVPRNQVRFIWFSGEEEGLLGSIHYADGLTKAERGNTLGMLDFDMLASPNYALQIYDGDGSEFGTAGPNGSGVIEKVFQDFFDARGLPTERIEFDGRSDYDEFTAVGIPAGGIAAGAEVHKTLQEQEWWGGTVSDGLEGQYDPCYHLACDSYGINGHPDNINNEALDVMSDAVVHAVMSFAQTTSSTNGTTKSSGSTKPLDWKGDHLVR